MDPALRHDLARTARRRHGIVTREELRELGLTDEAIAWALTTHQLVALFAGVYRVGGAPDTWRSRALAAQRRVERQLRRRASVDTAAPLAVVGGAAAGYLHGLPGHDRAPRLTITASRRCRSTAARVVRRIGLTDEDVVEVDRIPTTSLAWTAVERACAGDLEGDDVIAHVLGTGRLAPAQLAGPVRRTLTLPGRPALLHRLATIGGSTVDHVRSHVEDRLAEACALLGLPVPACNHPVTTTADRTYELDLAWPRRAWTWRSTARTTCCRRNVDGTGSGTGTCAGTGGRSPASRSRRSTTTSRTWPAGSRRSSHAGRPPTQGPSTRVVDAWNGPGDEVSRCEGPSTRAGHGAKGPATGVRPRRRPGCR